MRRNCIQLSEPVQIPIRGQCRLRYEKFSHCTCGYTVVCALRCVMRMHRDASACTGMLHVMRLHVACIGVLVCVAAARVACGMWMQWRATCGTRSVATLRALRVVPCVHVSLRHSLRAALHAARCTVALPALPALCCALRVTGAPAAPGVQGTPSARGGAVLIYICVAIHGA